MQQTVWEKVRRKIKSRLGFVVSLLFILLIGIATFIHEQKMGRARVCFIRAAYFKKLENLFFIRIKGHLEGLLSSSLRKYCFHS